MFGDIAFYFFPNMDNYHKIKICVAILTEIC